MVSHFLFTDESSKKGPYFNNFYGGLLVPASENETLIRRLSDARIRLGLLHEIKWQKVSSGYLPKFIEFIDEVFDCVEDLDLKLRIMFTHKYIEPTNLTKEQHENQYFLLYYQFIKHAFGFSSAPYGSVGEVALRLDQLPDKREKCHEFKEFLANLSRRKALRANGVSFPRKLISEIDSSKHVQAQALDLILGAMQFRLNDFHKAIPEGSKRRGARTVAKEKLYKHIRTRISQHHPNFNIGITTGKPNGFSDIWHMPYRHWRFTPTSYRINKDAKK